MTIDETLHKYMDITLGKVPGQNMCDGGQATTVNEPWKLG